MIVVLILAERQHQSRVALHAPSVLHASGAIAYGLYRSGAAYIPKHRIAQVFLLHITVTAQAHGEDGVGAASTNA